jgi:transglutaminase-like putative cysteine protease
MFGATQPGWARVQAISDFVHRRIRFDYQRADPRRTASGGLKGRAGVCRDFAHLAIALCRAMNIPARYCTGYLGDIGVPPAPYPMDFSAWMEVWLDGRWHTFDPRHNTPRIGRILMATGRDATDVAISTSFGAATLADFRVVTEEVRNGAQPALRAEPDARPCQGGMPPASRVEVFAEALPADGG